MFYSDSDMSKSTNTIVYFDWKTVIYIYACGKCHTQFMLPMEKLVGFTGECANEIIPSINRSFAYKAKEGRHVRIDIYFQNLSFSRELATGRRVVLAKKQFSPTVSFSVSACEFSSDFFTIIKGRRDNPSY